MDYHHTCEKKWSNLNRGKSAVWIKPVNKPYKTTNVDQEMFQIYSMPCKDDSCNKQDWQDSIKGKHSLSAKRIFLQRSLKTLSKNAWFIFYCHFEDCYYLTRRGTFLIKKDILDINL